MIPPVSDAPPPRTVPAVDRAARLLSVLESQARPMTISELARALGINKGTMRDLLETLRAHAWLERDDLTKAYRLGPRLARLGMAALGQLDLPSVARPFMQELADHVSGAVLLVVPHGDRATIVDKVDRGGVGVEVSANVGSRIRTAAGALGKVLLAHASAGEVERALADIVRPTPNTITDPSQYVLELERARRQGFATDDEEYLRGVRAAAAPVFDARGHLVAAVLVVALTGSLPPDDLPRTGEATARAASAISAALGAPD